MCGIAGIIGKRRIGQDEIASMTVALRHRGPDAEGTFISDDGTTTLGHTRLSIIDLSPEANQPFHSSDGRYVVVFNGEIYNFRTIRKEIETNYPDLRFRTSSDTEVIVVAFSVWGKSMVNKLEGMFAIAICDRQAGKVFLFRDRIGKKPLYYFSDEHHFIFASELKSLLKHRTVQGSRRIDRHAVNEFLHLGYIPEPRTIYQSIKKFPAGFFGEIGKDLVISLTPYWTPESCVKHQAFTSDPAIAKEALRHKLQEAVQKRLISDVPLGSFLSGGTDSSLVNSIAAGCTNGKLRTFTIGFKESAFDEAAQARRVAKHLKTDHHEYILSETEAAGILENYLHHFDEPFADTSAIPTMLVSSLARKEVKVVLTGDGGDELFQGYGSYRWAQRLKNPVFMAIRSPMAFVFKEFGNARLKRIAHLLEKVDEPGLRSHIFSQEQYFFSGNEIQNKLLKDVTDFQSFQYIDPAVHHSIGEADKQALFDLKFYLKDDLLVKVDRSSMFYALECRCPLLDHHVVEYALNISNGLKKKGGTSKWILKELLQEYLPADLVYRPKRGFSIPLSRWLKEDFRYLIDDYLDPQTMEEVGLVNPDFVKQLKIAFLQGEEYLYNRIWILVVLHKWLKDNKS